MTFDEDKKTAVLCGGLLADLYSYSDCPPP